jgi:poly-gamma-glutamate synthesis protein (capsule biosynthesis protein)
VARALRSSGAAGSRARAPLLALAGLLGCAGRPPEEREAGPQDMSAKEAEPAARLAGETASEQKARIAQDRGSAPPGEPARSDMSGSERSAGGSGHAPKDMLAATGVAPLPSPRAMPAGYLGFSRACEARERLVVAAVGDLLLHHELQIQATKAPNRFRVLWAGVEDLLQRADLTYANLEVPLAAGVLRSGEETADPGLVFDRKVYTAYPRFNVHPSMAEDLVTSGVDVVSTANNHALDRGSLGADKTIAALKAAGLKYTGTRARDQEKAPWHTTTNARGLTLAWLACTLHTNMIEDTARQVLRCFDDKTVETEVRRLAKDPAIDAVIVTPHWGKEYAPEPSKQQKEYARAWAEAGAAAIVGSHPHVLQPWEKLGTQDGREVLVAYSLGNFVSHQPELPKRSTIVLVFGLGRARAGEKAFVTGAGYVPVHVRETDAEYFAEAIDRVGGPADSRELIVNMFGADNVVAPDGPFEVAPQCFPK